MKILLIFLVSSISFISTFFQTPTWKKEQLMSTTELSTKLKTNAKDKPLVFNVGPMQNIKTAVAVGAATNITFASKMKETLAMENKTKAIVVYCGCCSYSTCPNIKPAYDALVEMGYKNTKVLELPVGLNPDWISKGFPME